MKRFFFPVWCKGSIGDSRSPDAGSSPATGSIDPHGHARHAPRIAMLAATLGLLTAYLAITSTTALAEPLPDGRVYEMVTPPSNYDANVYVPFGLPSEIVNNAGEFKTLLPFQVAVGGDAVAYVAAPTVKGTGNDALGEGDEYLSRWTAGAGWGAPNHLQPLGEKDAVVNSAFYQAFSLELTFGIVQSGSYREPGAPVLAPSAPGEGYSVLYSRLLEETGYRPFFTAKPVIDPVEFAAAEIRQISVIAPHQLAYAGASADNSRLLFEANGAFEGIGAVSGGAGENNLYESVGGVLSLVNVLPGGGSEPNATFGAEPLSSAAKPPPDFSNVISGDGSRVFWTDRNGGKALYVSEGVGSPGERTVQVDASVAGGAGGGGRFWTATKDGAKVFFTDSKAAGLTADTEPGSGEDLYVYETATHQLIDLTPSHEAEVQGVLGEGDVEGSNYTVYFTAKGAIATNKNGEGAQAVPGEDNLYMAKEGAAPVFIATLSGEDGNEANGPLARQVGEVGDWTPGVGHRTAEVTPDGRSLTFMSNHVKFEGHYEEAEGRRLEEVYVFDSEDGVDGGLFCASCARDGLKAQASVITAVGGPGAFLPVSNSLVVQPTLISGDGSRVFFDSDEPLVVGDTNGEQDVYEWERDGSGGCGVVGGCVFLLSGGSVSTSSWLVGGDAGGNNVFFVTRAQLAPQDENENYDLYDARVDGIQPVLPPACSGTGCQGVPAIAPTFATPSSATFEGVGNFAPPAETAAPAAPKPKVRLLTRAQKLTKALAFCHAKHPKRGARMACEKQARRAYGSKAKRK